jgi:hypothetical protein
MNGDIFIDGIENIVLSQGMVRMDLASFSFDKKDKAGNPAVETKQRIVMTPQGLLWTHGAIERMLNELVNPVSSRRKARSRGAVRRATGRRPSRSRTGAESAKTRNPRRAKRAAGAGFLGYASGSRRFTRPKRDIRIRLRGGARQG